jgi:hypothetical protein
MSGLFLKPVQNLMYKGKVPRLSAVKVSQLNYLDIVCRKRYGVVWTGFIWLRIGTIAGLS